MIVHPMTEPLGKDNIPEYLTAFADGELNATEILVVLEYIKAEPRALDVLMEQQHLRVAAMRAVLKHTPPVPAALSEHIADLASAAASQSISKPPPEPRARMAWRFWLTSLAAMLCLVAGIAIGYMAPRPPIGTKENVAVAPEAYDVPPSVVAAVTGVHVDCSRFAARLRPGAFPKELGAISAAVQEDFSRNEPYPDLSPIGYRFIDAGPCRKPLANTAHLVYQSTARNVTDKISIFVQPLAAHPQLEPGKFYLVSDADSPHPMFALRTSRAVYFLVGDEAEITERARGVLAVVTRR